MSLAATHLTDIHYSLESAENVFQPMNLPLSLPSDNLQYKRMRLKRSK